MVRMKANSMYDVNLVYQFQLLETKYLPNPRVKTFCFVYQGQKTSYVPYFLAASRVAMKSFSQVNILIVRMELMTSCRSRTRLSVRLAMASLSFAKPLPIRPKKRDLITVNISCKT